MAIKKQISFLAGSMLLTSNLNATILPSSERCCIYTDSTAILVLSSIDKGAYIYNTGLTTGQLANTSNLSIDLSIATTALGGSIDSFALFGTFGGTETVEDIDGAHYVDINGGVLYAQTNKGLIQTSADLESWRGTLNHYLKNLNQGGFFADTSIGDLDFRRSIASFLGVGLLNPNGATAYLHSQINSDEFDPDISAVQKQINATAQIINGNFAVSSIPLPAAAWLFASALAGTLLVKHGNSGRRIKY